MNTPMENENEVKTTKTNFNYYQKKNKYLIILLKLLIILSIFDKYNLTQSFLYPKAITLSNGNIFIIHKTGIDIYDSSLNKNLKNIEKINADKQLYNNYTITALNENDNKYIYSIIDDKLYIFNEEGEKYFIGKDKISLIQGNNYALIPFKKYNNNLFYMIGFINENNNIELLFFKFDENIKQNFLEYNISDFKFIDDDHSYLIKKNSLTCQMMHNYLNNDVIICFYGVIYTKDFITYFFFDINNYTFIDKYPTHKLDFPKEINEIKEIKSTIDKDNTKIIIYIDTNSGKAFFLKYFIKANFFSKFIEFNYNCKSSDSNIIFDYINHNNIYLFSCLNYKEGINVIFFNTYFKIENNITINENKYKFGYSIIYSNIRKKYLIIPDDEYKNKMLNIEENKFFRTLDLRRVNNNDCGDLEKCQDCDELSIKKELCTECNIKNNYYPIDPHFDNEIEYMNCYNNNTKPKNFYLNKDKYEPCYSTCSTCNYGGDGNTNNCTSCAMDYTFEPDNLNKTNCVVMCKNFYYYLYGQYKCSPNPQCPVEKNLLIKAKNKCVDSCSKDENYTYQYNGECLNSCPKETTPDDNKICKVINKESCSKSSTQFDLYDFLKEGGIENIAKTYATEFSYTTKHISLFKNEVYSIMLYKSPECITELKLPMPEIDFGSCYIKLQSVNKIEGPLIVAVIDKSSSKKSNPITSYFFYSPITGEKLESENTCKDETIVVKENIKALLNDSNVQVMDSILFLTEQNINVFNKTADFYTDLCYHYESPCNKDVALRDRLLIYYPNITLCDTGCTVSGVNLTSMTAICKCQFKNMNDSDEVEGNNFYQSAVNEVFNIINQINLDVLACYKDIFEYKYFISCTGGLILLFLIFIQLISCFTYYFISFFSVKKYMYNITENYLLFLNKSPMYKPYINKVNEEEKDKKSQKGENCPPKKIPEEENNNINIYNKKVSIKTKKSDNKKKILNTQEGSEDKNNSKMVLCGQKLVNKKLRTKSNSNVSNLKLAKTFSSSKSNEKSNTNSSNTTNIKNNLSFFENYLSTHLNEMLFNDALVKDKRLFFDYFCDKIKRKQVILDIFLINDPIKPKTLKILLLILDLEICFVINGMFINEDYVSKLFHSTKEENFFSFLPRSINRFVYTIFVSIVVSYLVGCFFIEERRLKSIFKYEKNNVYAIKYEIYLVMREMNWRYNIFILFSIVVSVFSWYYITCFNNIYPHTKIEWLKSSIVIIILVHLLSIMVTLVETLLRFVSFEIKSEKMYKASLWLA